MGDLNTVQNRIMVIVQAWGQHEKKPITQAEIIHAITQTNPIAERSYRRALSELLKKGYIRKTVILANKRTAYVQLRSV